MSTSTLEHAHPLLHAPAIVARECLTTNAELQKRLAHLGFSSVLEVQSSANVLAITSDKTGYVHAAGLLIMTPHLMGHHETSLPEIHVRTGVEEEVIFTKDGQESITWSIDDISKEAAGMTVDALRRIAHRRDVWSLKPPLVGVPPSTVGGPLWNVSQTLDIR